MALKQSATENPIVVVQGAQWGSEAKGAVAAALVDQREIDYAVRTGTVNAGHTVYWNGKPYKMQQLPTGWIRPETVLVIGPGAYIHPDVLLNEMKMLIDAMPHLIPWKRVMIDYRCGLHLPTHTERSTASGRHHSMGATGKGCSEAVIDKIRGRGDNPPKPLFQEWLSEELGKTHTPYEILRNLLFTDTAKLLNNSWDNGAKILIEGTQGTMLDLHLGPYPYTTHKQTQVGNWMAEAGLSPALPVEVCLVARTFPIRVAGNSGPMPREISWIDLANGINARLAAKGKGPRVEFEALRLFEDACQAVAEMSFKIDDYHIEAWPQEKREEYPVFVSELHKKALSNLPHGVVENLTRLFEMTTVTNKLRRIAELDMASLEQSIQLNRPAYLAMTFVNYLFPEVWDQEFLQMEAGSRKEVLQWVNDTESYLQTPIRYISTGAKTRHVLEIPGGSK